MAVKYNIVQAGGTSTDLNVSVEELTIKLEMTEYRSGIHQINRSGESVAEEIQIPLLAYDARVSIYLESDPETIETENGISVAKNEGTFVVDVVRTDIDVPYAPNDLVMHIGTFNLPAGTLDLNDCDIEFIKVV